MGDRDVLDRALAFHGHRCYASVAGVRCGLAGLRALDVARSGGTQLYAVLETGEEHGGMCFGDGVQFTTGCTLGKGNVRKQPLGKLAFMLIEKSSGRAVRASYRPTLQGQIAESAFMRKRAAGMQPDDIPEDEQMALVDLVWNAPEADVVSVSAVFESDEEWLPEVMGFRTCASCGELVAHAYVRLVGDRPLCIPCSGYDR